MSDPWTVLAWLIVVVMVLGIAVVIVGGVFALRQQLRINRRIAAMRAKVERGVRR